MHRWLPGEHTSCVFGEEEEGHSHHEQLPNPSSFLVVCVHLSVG